MLTAEGAYHETIRRWIMPPEFQSDFDKAKKARSPGSCNWLQSEPAYVSWKAELQTAETEPSGLGKFRAQPCQPILWLEGRLSMNLSEERKLSHLSGIRSSWLWKDDTVNSCHRRPQQCCLLGLGCHQQSITTPGYLLLFQRTKARAAKLL